MKKVNYWILPIGWAFLIFILSTFRVNKTKEFDPVDFTVKKTAHILEYAIFFTLLYRAFLNSTSLTKVKSAFLSLLVVFFYAISDEYHQSFTPGREPQVRDVILDTFGGILAWFGIWKLLPKAPRRLVDLGRELEII